MPHGQRPRAGERLAGRAARASRALHVGLHRRRRAAAGLLAPARRSCRSRSCPAISRRGARGARGAFPLALSHGPPRRFRDHLRSLGLPPGPALVAVSGGPDSVALLDLFCRTRDAHGLELVVATWTTASIPPARAWPSRWPGCSRSSGVACLIGRPALGPDAARPRPASARYAWLDRAADRLGAGPSSRPITPTIRSRPCSCGCWAARARPGWPAWPRSPAGWFARSCRFAASALARLCRGEPAGSLARSGQPGPAPPAVLASGGAAAAAPAGSPRSMPHLARVAAHAAATAAAWDAAAGPLSRTSISRTESDGISVAALFSRAYDSTLGGSASPGRGSAGRVPARAPRGRPGFCGLLDKPQRPVGVPLGRGWTRRARLRSAACWRASEPVPSSVELARAEAGRARGVGGGFAGGPEPAPERQERDGLHAPGSARAARGARRGHPASRCGRWAGPVAGWWSAAFRRRGCPEAGARPGRCSPAPNRWCGFRASAGPTPSFPARGTEALRVDAEHA